MSKWSTINWSIVDSTNVILHNIHLKAIEYPGKLKTSDMCGFFCVYSYQKTIESQDPFFFEVEIWLNVYPFIISLVVKLTCLSWKFAKKVGNHLILILNEYELLNLKIYQVFTKSGKIDKKSSFLKFFSDDFFMVVWTQNLKKSEKYNIKLGFRLVTFFEIFVVSFHFFETFSCKWEKNGSSYSRKRCKNDWF